MPGPTESELSSFMASVRSGDVAEVKRRLGDRSELAGAHDPGCFGAIPLRHAVDRNDRAMIDALLDGGADIDARSDWWAGGFGVLPCGDAELGEYLLTRGASLDAYGAAGMGWTDRLREILDRDPSQVNMKGGDGQRPLHQAHTTEIIDLLVERGAELDARDVDHGSTPAQYLVATPDLCRRLIEHGAEGDIFIACVLGDAGLAHRVFDAAPDALDARIGLPPFVSTGSEGGHIYIYTLGYPTRPLALAARNGHRELLDMLVDKATPAQKLLLRCWEADAGGVDALLAAHPGLVAALRQDQLDALPDAAWENRVDAVRVMLNAGFEVDVKGRDDSTALDRACFHGFVEIIDLLLSHGPSLDVTNKYGGTPLECCVHGSVHGWRDDGDYPAGVEALIRAGATFAERWIPCGNEAVDEVLRRNLAESS